MAFAGGKVILLGEHAVVYGRPALAAGLARGVHAEATFGTTDRLRVEPWGTEVGVHQDEPLARAFAALLARLPEGRPTVDVLARVGLPAGAGVGCSAALGVAVTRAIDEAMGVVRHPRSLADLGFAWEGVFHGTPSGVDHAMAASGGVALFVRGKPLEPVRVARPLRLVVCHGGEPSITRTTVAAVAKAREREPVRIESLFDGIESTVKEGRAAVERGDLHALGAAFDKNQAALASLGLSTARLDALCEAARGAGALGAKLTGGGGGGCMIALVEDDASTVSEALRGLDADPFVTEAGA